MKRRFATALLAVFLLFCSAPLSPAAGAYTDTGGSWAAQVIDQAGAYGLLQGYPDGSFGVGRDISRGEFATVLCRMFSWEEAAPETPSYPDCPRDKWCFPYVEAALLHGALLPGGLFRPDDPISREEMAVMLVRALGYDTLAQSLAGASLPFDDVTGNRGYIAIAYDTGMITGVEREDRLLFLPGASAKREEAAAMLVRVYEKYTSKTQWLHGFYAFSSFSQIGLTDQMDGVSVGWARMEYSPETGPWLNSTNANGNDWVKPADPTPATGYFQARNLPYNLNVYASASDQIPLPDGTTASTISLLTATAEARSQAVSALVSAAGEYAGLTIDFEGLKGEAVKDGYVAFMTELRAALPGDKTLYVCVQPDTWYTGFDYRRLGAVCDKVILMAHDYQWTAAEARKHVGTDDTDSPVTPFAGIYDALKDITDPEIGVEDRSKLALAISFGTAGLRIDENGVLVEERLYHPSQETLARRLAQPDTVVAYSALYRNPVAVYTTEDGGRYRIWYENQQSVLDKLALARMFGIQGVSLWRIGNIPVYEGHDIWSGILSTR